MVIEIDQSGKVEDTGVDTIVGAANKSFTRSVKLPAREKRKLQKFFRSIGKPRMYTYHVFAVLLFILLRKHIRKIDSIIIDREYVGKEELIRNLLTAKIQYIYPDFDPDVIVFQAIGKKSVAHILVYDIYKKRKKPNVTVTFQDVLKILTK